VSNSLRASRWRSALVPTIVITAAIVAAIVFRRPLVAWFTGQPMGGSSGPPVTANAGPFAIEARLAPDPPRQKDQALVLTIRDDMGKAVDDATVEVAYDMPAMGAMAEMKGGAKVTHDGDGVYRAQFDLPMASTWGLRATVRAGSRSASQGFQMTVGSAGLTLTGGGGGTGPSAAKGGQGLEHMEYPPMAFDAMRSAMDAYDRARAKLVGDNAHAVGTDAHAMAEALRAVHDALPSSRGDLIDATTAAREAAIHLAAATTIDETRNDFAALSSQLLPLIGADARLTSGWHVFECPMFEGHPHWMQRSPGADNPYMGARMPSCGTATTWQPTAEAESPSTSAPGAIDHYTCSMHPSVKQSGPGTCPICGMGLIPVTKEQQEQGVVMIDEGRRQLIGVRTEPVVSAPMRDTFRAVGHVTYDESALSDVNLKVHGWITKLYVSETGQRVGKGQPLFSIYSPELYNAEQDFLLGVQGAAASAATADSPNTPHRPELLARASRQRLHLLGLSDAQIDAIGQSGKPSEDIAIASPSSGFVIEKNVVEGASVDAGMRLYRIAALSKVWVDADVFEADLARVRVGQRATVTLDYLPGRAYEAKVAYVYPYLDPTARTGRVRLELANKELDLRPGMYASVTLSSDLGTRVQVPAAAVVYTGPRRLVFVDIGGGRFRPTAVQVGTASNGMYEVLGGVAPGDQVATSGVFLIAAEARISTAAKYWDSTTETDAGAPSEAMPPAPEPMPPQSPTGPPKGGMREPGGGVPAPAPMLMNAPAPAMMPTTAPAPMALPPASSSAPAEKDFSCPMHPEVHSTMPGKCPKCGMDLVPAPRQP
jgi:Cu(I)/Ag(I) efflux system membrane fusion protein